MARMVICFLVCIAAIRPDLTIAGGTPDLVQQHYRWRNDDGGESNATWKAAADTAVTGVTRGTNIRLRIAVYNGGTGAGMLYARPEFSSSISGPWTTIPAVADGLSPFAMSSTTNYANDSDTTAMLPATGGFISGKAVSSPTNASSGVIISANMNSNFEFCFKAGNKAMGGSNYYFRVAGLTSYSTTAQLAMAPGEVSEPPVIMSSLVCTASYASVMNYQIQAAGSEPIAYGVSGLPAGLGFGQGNMITGTPSVVGVFNVDLTASNAFGMDSKTLVLTTMENQAPVALNTNVTVASGGQVACTLAATDPEQNPMTYVLVTQPAHGTVGVRPDSANWTYSPAAGYAGSDSFQWRADDSRTNSNTATVSITVNPCTPVPQEGSACGTRNTVLGIPALYSGGGGYALAPATVTGPAHGSITISNLTFLYTPATNYTGADQFTWRMTYGATGITVAVTNSIWVKDDVYGSDWPMWRFDEYRSAATPEELPAALNLHWRRDLPAYESPGLLTKNAADDAGYLQPVMAGTTVVVNVSGRDKLVALDAISGAVKWTFYTDGPTRFAPVISGGRVYAPSDDGYLYCLDIESGALLCRIAAGPSNRKYFGQCRMISPWMVRGAPVAAGGRVYFASGLWPMEGVFAYAVNGATGNEVWRNDGLSGLIQGQPHDLQPIPTGPSPQGYLCMKSDNSTLYLPSTEAEPLQMNPATGDVISWPQGGRYDSGVDSQGYKTIINGGEFVNLGPFNMAVAGIIPMKVTAGSRSYTVADVTALGVYGTVSGMIAGGQQLYVMTREGSLYCFGAGFVNPGVYTGAVTSLPAIADQWTTNAAQILAGITAREGCILVAGIGTGRLAAELVKQAPARATIVAIDPDANKVAALRATMDAAGCYGSRISALTGDPLASGFPQYGARLVVSEDPVAAGYGTGNDAAFVTNLYRVIMPYGGMAWLPMAGGQQAAFEAQVAAAGLDLVAVGRSEPFALVTRTGLRDASNAKAGSVAYDKTVRGPLGFLWFHAANSAGGHLALIPNSDNYDGVVHQSGGVRPYVDAFSGLPLSASTWDGAAGIISTSSAGVYVNPFTGLPGPGRTAPKGYGCGAGYTDFGYTAAGRGGTAVLFDGQLSGAGTLHIAGVRSACNDPGGNVGSGVHYWDTPGCYCAYPLRASFALAPVPEVENWSRWGKGPVQDVLEERPVRFAGINFGAPADHMAPDMKVWVNYPAQVGSSPNMVMAAKGAGILSTYHHSSRIRNSGLKFVAASSVRGMTNFVLKLSQPAVAAHAAGSPVIDGVLNDLCWNGTNELLLVNTGSPGYPEAARAWMRYDATNLYVAFVCDNAIPQNPSFDTEQDTRWHVYLSSREKLVATGSGRYAHFAVSYTGNRYTWLGDTGSESGWSGAWTGAVSGVYGQPFTGEFSIPWSSVEAAGLWKEDLVVNLYGPGYRRLRDLQDVEFWQASEPVGSYAGGVTCGRFVPMFLDRARGDSAVPMTNVSVKLHFAETEGASAGERVFGVKLQGNTVLPGFDIAQVAGGQNLAVVQEVVLPSVQDNTLTLDLVPVTGVPAISGLEVTGNYGARTNQPPDAVADITPSTGPAPLAVTLSARRSSDPDGQIATCYWTFGDGLSAQGSLQEHTYHDPGTYTVVLTVKDSDGAVDVTTATVTVGGNPSSFISKIRSGLPAGDFTNLASWAAAIQSDLTRTDSMVFAVSGTGTYDRAVDDGAAVTFSGGGTGTLKHINLSGLAYIVGCTNTITAGPVICASGHSFTVSDAGRQIRDAVAECYNDWPYGMPGGLTLGGWGANATNHRVRIIVPVPERHTGKPFDAVGRYTGFAVAGGLALNSPVQCEGLVVSGGVSYAASDVYFDKGIIYRGGVSGGYGGRILMQNTSILRAQGTALSYDYGFGVFCNVTIAGATGYGVNAGGRFTLYNVLVSGSGSGDVRSKVEDGGLHLANCAVGDASLMLGGCNYSNRVFTFVDAAGLDYHLSPADTGAKDLGLNLKVLDIPGDGDIDGDLRTAAWDIGADEMLGMPGITSALAVTGAVGQAFTYTISSSGSTPFTFGAENLPSGLSLTGAVISGIPATAGTGNVMLTVQNSYGVSSNTLVLVILPANTAPAVLVPAAAAPGTVNGTGTVLSVLGTDDGGESNLTYTWSAAGTPPAPVTFSANGNNAAKNAQAVFHAAGVYTLQVVIRDSGFGTPAVTGSVAVTVNQTLTAIAVTPADVNLRTNETRQFTAAGSDQFGLSISAVYVWSVSGGGTIDAGSGLFAAGLTAGGPYTVRAVSGSLTGTASVAVSTDNVRKMKISFGGYTRSEPLTNFPALVRFSTAMTNGFAYSQFESAAGNDLRFKDAQETGELNYELDSWNTNGESCVWVQVPVLTSNSYIWAYWGDATLAPAAPVYTTNGATWSNGYSAVWHLRNGTTLSGSDSTSNRNDGTVAGATASNGVVNGSGSFVKAGSQRVTVPLSASLQPATALTVEGWINASSWSATGAYDNSIVGGDSIDPGGYALRCGRSSGGDANGTLSFVMRIGSNWSEAARTNVMQAGNWYYAVATYDGSTVRLFLNGVQQAGGSLTGAITPSTRGTSVGAGCYMSGAWGRYFDGKIDEARVGSVARSSNWVWACYQNVVSNSLFCDAGPVAGGQENPDGNLNGMPDAWEILNFGATTNANGGADADWDGDGMNNLAEYLAGTSPTSAVSRLEIGSFGLQGSGGQSGTNIVISWSSETGRWYRIQSSTNLLAGFGEIVVSNVPATPALNMYTVTVDQVRARYFRVAVEQ